MLYDNLGEVDRSMLGDMAARVGGDRKEFDRCMKSDIPKRWVARGKTGLSSRLERYPVDFYQWGEASWSLATSPDAAIC